MYRQKLKEYLWRLTLNSKRDWCKDHSDCNPEKMVVVVVVVMMMMMMMMMMMAATGLLVRSWLHFKLPLSGPFTLLFSTWWIMLMMIMITTWSASRMIHFIYTCTPSRKKLQMIQKKKVKKWKLCRGMLTVNCTLHWLQLFKQWIALFTRPK